MSKAEYPEEKQVETVKLVEAGLSVAVWPNIYSLEALECAADELERQVAEYPAEPANSVLVFVAAHYRSEAKDRRE